MSGADPSETQFAVKAVTVRDGIRLEYVERGDPSGMLVVLLHGFADSWRSFQRVLPHLPSSVHAFAPTQTGSWRLEPT